MQEFKLFDQIPRSGKFHSCILSTFSFDYHFFDTQIRKQLQKKEIYNIIILCDTHMIDQSFGSFSMGSNSLMKNYTVTPIHCQGVFHPKMALFFGEDEMMMHLGSGNLTSGGLGKNHELFSSLSTNDVNDSQFPILQSAANYLVGFLKENKGFVNTQLNWIIKHCSLLEEFGAPTFGQTQLMNENQQLTFLANEEQSIYDQMLQLIPKDEIEEIQIISPYFDTKGTFLTQLSKDFDQAIIKLLVQSGKTVLPTAFDWTNQFEFYDWSATKRAKAVSDSDKRLNHSKVFIFKSSDAIYLLHGSPNATAPAFGLHSNYRNEEAAFLFQLDKDWAIDSLGVTSDAPLDLKNIISAKYSPAPHDAIQYSKSLIKILGADKQGSFLQIHLSKALSASQKIVFLDQEGEVITVQLQIKKSQSEVKIKLSEYPVLRKAFALCVFEQNQKISNYAFLNEVDSLRKGNPDKENRKFQKLFSKIQFGDVNEFDILSHLNTILDERNREKKTTSKTFKEKEDLLSTTNELTYEDAKKRAEQESSELPVFRYAQETLKAIQLLFQFIKESKEEKETDQEEEGATDDGGGYESEKRFYDKEKQFRSDKEFGRYQEKVFNFFEKYITYLETVSEKESYEITTSELCYFMILMYQLIYMCDKGYDVKEGEETVNEVLIPEDGFIFELDNFGGIGLALIGNFSLLLNKFPKKKYEDEYLQKEFDHAKVQCSVMIYYSLILQLGVRKKNTEWYAMLWKNITSGLHKLDKKSYNVFHTAIQANYENLPKVNHGKIYKSIKTSCQVIEKDLLLDVKEKQYIQLPYFGFCKITKKIPSSSTPTSVKVSLPGVHNYDKIKQEFEYESIYNFERKKFYQSKQQAE